MTVNHRGLWQMKFLFERMIEMEYDIADGMGLFELIVTFSFVFGVAGVAALISSFFILRK